MMRNTDSSTETTFHLRIRIRLVAVIFHNFDPIMHGTIHLQQQLDDVDTQFGPANPKNIVVSVCLQ